MKIRSAFVVLFTLSLFVLQAQDFQIALLKYRGGGDWYANPTSLPNLVKYANTQLNTIISTEIATVEPEIPASSIIRLCI